MKKVLAVLMCLSLICLSACSRNTTTLKHEIVQEANKIVNTGGVEDDNKEKIPVWIEKEAYNELKDELEFMNSFNLDNVTSKVDYSGRGYNSLGKDFYDLYISGLSKTGGKYISAEIFLFIDEKGKVNKVGTWSRNERDK